MENGGTMKIKVSYDKSTEVRNIINEVYQALTVKGYDPVSQIVGYILSDDPTYITGFNGARTKITQVERDELLEELVKSYISQGE